MISLHNHQFVELNGINAIQTSKFTSVFQGITIFIFPVHSPVITLKQHHIRKTILLFSLWHSYHEFNGRPNNVVVLPYTD